MYSKQDGWNLHHEARGAHRKALGAFFTPYWLAREIVDHTVIGTTVGGTVLDPACGTGVFLSATLHRMTELGQDPATLVDQQLFGVDIDLLAVRICSILLRLEAGAPSDRGALLALDVNRRVGDSLTGPEFGPPRAPLLNDGAFDWGREFPKVAAAGGFDAVVMNPPYDRMKLDLGTASEKAIERTRVDFYRSCGRYPMSDKGTLELYRLFVERALHLIRPDGRLGAVVPLTLLGDRSAAKLRRHLMERCQFETATLLPEKLRVFDAVNQAVVVIVAEKAMPADDHQLVLIEAGDIARRRRLGTVALSMPATISPETRPIPITDNRGLQLLEALHAHPRIGTIPWVLNRRGELDLTFDRDYLGHGRGYVLRGRNLDSYVANATERVDVEAFVADKAASERTQHILLERVAGHQIANMGLRQRLRFAKVDAPVVLANSLNYLIVSDDLLRPPAFTLYTLLGCLNSMLLDWRFRLTSTNNHINNYELDDLPLPVGAPAYLLQEISDLAKLLQLSGAKSVHARQRLEFAVLEAFGVREAANWLATQHPNKMELVDTSAALPVA